MARPEHQLLPHGATGIQIDDIAVEFRPDKVIFLQRSTQEHYTVEFGQGSSVLDVHRTWRDDQGVTQHKTLFAIRHADLADALGELANFVFEFLRLVRPLRLGWVGHHRLTIARGLTPILDEEIAAVTRRRQGRKRLIVDEQRWRDQIIVPEFLEDVWDFPDGAFSLLDDGSQIGIGIKKTDAAGWARLYWIKLRDLGRLGAAQEERMISTLLRHAVPPKQYPNYPVLET